jgi:hypothetical protein
MTSMAPWGCLSFADGMYRRDAEYAEKRGEKQQKTIQLVPYREGVIVAAMSPTVVTGLLCESLRLCVSPVMHFRSTR